MTIAASFSPPRTILLATDLSARCDRALDRAVQLARQWRARLVALTVVDAGTLSAERVRATPLPSWATAPDDPMQRAFQRLRRDACAEDVEIIPRVEEGRVGEVLARVAAEEDAGLIVTGIARNESLGRTVLGSTVDWLARHATVPVLVVRDRVRGAYRNVVVASDFSASSRLALDASLALFPGVETTLFHAFDVPFAGMMDTTRTSAIENARTTALAEGARLLDAAGLAPEQRARVRLMAEQGEPVRLTYEYARDHDADLIALGTHGRSGLFNILIGSVARLILETAVTDVLLVRDPRAAE